MTATTESTSVRQLTAPNVSVEAENGVTFAYRRFGDAAGRPPLVFPNDFRRRRRDAVEPSRRHHPADARRKFAALVNGFLDT